MCRRAAGSPMVGWFTVPRGTYRVVSGDAGELPLVAAGGAHVLRSLRHAADLRIDAFPDETDITICSLDDPEQVPPRDHTRAATKLSWVKLADGLPVYPEQRTG